MESVSAQYRGAEGEEYLAQRQGALSDHVQSLRASLFTDLGGADRTILDFGCGAGGLISRVPAQRRIGIEIGEAAAALARASGVEVFGSLDAVPDKTVDIAISFHAIEHVERPVEILTEIGRVVKDEGHIRLVVPAELATEPQQREWRPNRDLHLYTWTPLLFGNLAHLCGYRDIRTKVAPMPTGSRLVRALSLMPPLARATRWRMSRKQNAINVILDARPPAGESV